MSNLIKEAEAYTRGLSNLAVMSVLSGFLGLIVLIPCLTLGFSLITNDNSLPSALHWCAWPGLLIGLFLTFVCGLRATVENRITVDRNYEARRDLDNRLDILRNLNFVFIEWYDTTSTVPDLETAITSAWKNHGCLTKRDPDISFSYSIEVDPTFEELIKGLLPDHHKAALVIRPRKDGCHGFCFTSKEGSSLLTDTLWKYLPEGLSIQEQADYVENQIIKHLKVNMHAGVSGMIKT